MSSLLLKQWYTVAHLNLLHFAKLTMFINPLTPNVKYIHHIVQCSKCWITGIAKGLPWPLLCNPHLKFQSVARHTRYIIPDLKGLTELITSDTVPIVAFKLICFPCRMDNLCFRTHVHILITNAEVETSCWKLQLIQNMEKTMHNSGCENDVKDYTLLRPTMRRS